MKKFILALCVEFLLYGGIANAQWAVRNSITGSRDGAVSWNINNKFYVVGGNGYGDLKEYDPATNQWTSKAPIPLGVRGFAMGFVINGKGYLCGGSNASGSASGALLQYDPSLNQWSTKAPLPSSIVAQSAFAFSIGNKGYIGCGDDGVYIYADVFEYDATTDTWATKNQFMGGVRDFPYSFTIGNKGYVGGGQKSAGESNDLWEYDQVNDSWIQKASMPGVPRQAAASFASSTKGYVALGQTGYTNALNDVYEYDPTNDAWDTISSFTPGARAWPVGFSNDSSIFICTGWNFSTYYSSMYKLTLIAATSNTQTATGISRVSGGSALVSYYPNPNKGQLDVSLASVSDNTFVEVYNGIGELMKREKLIELKNRLQLNIPEGVYLIQIRDQNRIISQAKLIRD